jgi:hypothetical protein
MNYLGVHVYPGLLEESWRDFARERRERLIAEARAARPVSRPSRFATMLRKAVQPKPAPRAAGCS